MMIKLNNIAMLKEIYNNKSKNKKMKIINFNNYNNNNNNNINNINNNKIITKNYQKGL